MTTKRTARTGPAKPCHRYEVVPTGTLPACPLLPSSNRWCVRTEGETHRLVSNAPYEVACAIARHLNGQNPESGDIQALVCYSLGYCGDRP